MKALRFVKLWALALFIPLVSSSRANACDSTSFVFPLDIGDIWTYSVSNEVYPGYHYYGTKTLRLERDTVMPNGKKYFLMPAMAAYLNYDTTRRFLRKDALKVYQFDEKDSSEYLRYDFSAHIGDTITIFTVDPFQGIILLDTTTLNFINKHKLRMFNFSGQLVADSVGIAIYFDHAYNDWRLIGAKVNGIEYGTVLSAHSQSDEITNIFNLFQNYPNPFNPRTIISFDLPKNAFVRLSIYDCLGREISTLINDYRLAGHQEVIFNADKFSSGIYFCRIVSTGYSSTRKMLLVK